MTINKERNNETLTLVIEGRLDTVTAPELEKVVNEGCQGLICIIL